MAQNTFANIVASTTDGALVSSISGRIIRVLGVACNTGATATNVTFNSKGSGTGTAISALFATPANGGFVLPIVEFQTQNPWFQTNSGEALTVTTGAGSTVGIQVVYDYIAPPGGN